MSLKKIAASMHVEAKEKGKSARTLSRGLRLVLIYRRDEIVLALSRPKVLPSEKEVEICQTNFFFGYQILCAFFKGGTKVGQESPRISLPPFLKGVGGFYSWG